MIGAWGVDGVLSLGGAAAAAAAAAATAAAAAADPVAVAVTCVGREVVAVAKTVVIV
jgi:hypothetical protein